MQQRPNRSKEEDANAIAETIGGAKVSTISRRTSGDTVTVAISGEVDLAAVPDIDATLQTALADHHVTRLVVDLSHLDFIDSSAIGALVRARNAALDKNQTFQVINVNGLPDRAMRVTGILDVLTGSTDAAPIP